MTTPTPGPTSGEEVVLWAASDLVVVNPNPSNFPSGWAVDHDNAIAAIRRAVELTLEMAREQTMPGTAERLPGIPWSWINGWRAAKASCRGKWDALLPPKEGAKNE